MGRLIPPDKPEMKLAQRLRFFRKRTGLTQKKIAGYLFVDRSTYSYYECGKTRPNIKVLTRLADLYGISIDELTGHLTTSVSKHSRVI